MTLSAFVDVLGLCLGYIVQWLLKFVNLYNTNVVLMSVVALVVLGLVVDLFLYIIPKK